MNRQSIPTISVIVASYNHHLYIQETLESILAQSFGDFEIIVVDDGSSDGSWQIIQDFAARDARLHAFKHPDGQNHGLTATLLLALAHCRGEYVAFLESDDLWRHDCLKKRLEALRRSGCRAVFNAVETLPMPGATTHLVGYCERVMGEHAATLRRAPDKGLNLHYGMLIENKIPTFSCVMLNRDLLQSCNFHTPVNRCLDWWLWQQIAPLASFAFVQESLTIWRIHTQSYNYTASLNRYVQTHYAIWKGLRRFQPEEQSPGCGWKKAFLLRGPLWLRFAVKFALLARYAGFWGTLSKVYTTLKGYNENTFF